MDFPFFTTQAETATTIRQKAEALLNGIDNVLALMKNKNIPGETRLNISGQEGDFRQFRAYRPEDRPQDIDWKRSARSDDLLIKEREKNQRQSVNIQFAPSAGMKFKSLSSLMTKHETAVVLATVFALWAKRNHNLIYLNGHAIGIDDFAHEALDIRTAPQPRQNTLTVMVGDLLDEFQSLENLFASLPSRDVVLLQILDPAECELPYHGRTLFEFGHEATTINNVDAVRDDYTAALNAHLNQISAYADKRYWQYELIRTDRDIAPVLASIFYKIGDRA